MSLRVGLVVPHIFMQDDLLNKVIFSPGELALNLANKLTEQSIDVTLFTPGSITTKAKNITADLSGFQAELTARKDTYLSLLKKRPLAFITLARQVQAELLKTAFQMANNNELDVVHIYTNEEELGLIFSDFCTKPVVFTHHDPFNLLVGYRNIMPAYAHKNWLAISEAQKKDMPNSTNWLDTIYNSLDESAWQDKPQKKQNYLAYYGRIIESKGTHLAIQTIQKYNKDHPDSTMQLKIAGKYYSDAPDSYWAKYIEPALNDEAIEYVGFISDQAEKQTFLGQAKALLVPSLFAEPFGMVMLEALASSTAVIGLSSGAIPEVIKNGITGVVVEKKLQTSAGLKQVVTDQTINALSRAIEQIDSIDPSACRRDFEQRFTLSRMAEAHVDVYKKLSA